MSTTSEMPEDSVLRRHWLAARGIQSDTSATTSSKAPASSSGGGIFSWLKSLFS